MVESDVISQVGKFVLLANLLEGFLILRSESSLINSGLPAKIALIGLLHLLHVLRALNVDGGLRLNPKSLPRGLLDRTFQLHPIDPNRGRRSVPVLLLVAVEFFSDKFCRLGLAFLDADCSRRAFPEFNIDLNDLRILNGAGYLLHAEQFGEAG